MNEVVPPLCGERQVVIDRSVEISHVHYALLYSVRGYFLKIPRTSLPARNA